MKSDNSFPLPSESKTLSPELTSQAVSLERPATTPHKLFSDSGLRPSFFEELEKTELRSYKELKDYLEKYDIHYLRRSGLAVMKEHYNSCGKNAVLKLSCASCGHGFIEKEIRLTCQLRYDSNPHCVRLRIAKARKRLDSYGIKSGRLIHVVVGFPRKPKFHRIHKKIEEKLLSDFHRLLKKRGLEFNGLRIFDFQDDDDAYTHYHYALLPSCRRGLDIRRLQSVRKEFMSRHSTPLAVRVIGWRHKSGLFNYFARRMAGQYGEKKQGYFYLENLMSIEEYYVNFYRVRSLVQVSRRLSCIIVPVSFSCPICHCDKLRFSLELVDESVKEGETT